MRDKTIEILYERYNQFSNYKYILYLYFPDIPGCISFGETLEEAQENAKEALELHVYGLEKFGEDYQLRRKN